MKIKGEYRDVLSRNGAVIMDTGWKSNVIVEDYGRFLAALMKKDFEQKVGIDYMAVGSGSGEDSAVFRDKVIKFIDECLYLFSMNVSFEKDLNNKEGNISEELKNEFKTKKDITLSNSAKIRKRKENEWVITDGEKIYIVKKEDGKLNVGLGPLEVGEKGKKDYYWVWAKEIKDRDIKYLNQYLFSIEGGELENELNGSIIPEDLKKKFQTKGIPLSETATVTKENEDKWMITDEEKGKSYFIRKEEEKLNIYLNPEEVDTVTNRIKIDVKFGNEEPSEEPLEFKEFALLGIDKKNSDGTFDTEKMFFINYVDHGVITKYKSTELKRTVKLTFPINKEEKEEEC